MFSIVRRITASVLHIVKQTDDTLRHRRCLSVAIQGKAQAVCTDGLPEPNFTSCVLRRHIE
jgi:hypothetical protein